MTEFEKVVVENLIKTDIVKLYARDFDETLLVMKKGHRLHSAKVQ